MLFVGLETQDMSRRLRFGILGMAAGCLFLALASVPVAAAGDEGEVHWAFVRPQPPPVPVVQATAWVRNPIDAFILRGLEEFGLQPSPEADRATLLRRLTFDLTGLPPSPQEIHAFLDDTDSDAYEKLVDRLLASPHYGERRAQHWLDLARYADSDGFEFDQARPDAWRFRDWVVSALNRDLPYDRFVRLQMAGDELEPGNPEAHVATGFHRCYPDMVDLNDQGLRRQNALNDITETTGLVFLGLTIGCARCHDHKYDPISQADFYRLQAFFTPATFEDQFPVVSPAEQAEHARAVRDWRQEVAASQSALIRLEAPVRNELAAGLPPNLKTAAAAAFAKAEEERSPEEVGLVFEALSRDTRVEESELVRRLGPERAGERSAWIERLARLRASEPPALPMARVLGETGPEAPPTHLLLRGDFSSPGPVVTPAFPAVLEGSDPEIEATAHTTGRRAALARWLTRPDHPLTARVMVNRLWQRHFGRGIVATPSDFGTMGERPSHPELLDWLACEFVARGWSLKALHRLIVTSATYQQSSLASPEARELDPENLLVGHQGRRRLEGEAIRDALLAASGRLNPALGGPCVFPELPEELTKLSSKGKAWPVTPDPTARDRRSLYVFVRRNLRFPFFEVFDRPDTNASCPRRQRVHGGATGPEPAQQPACPGEPPGNSPNASPARPAPIQPDGSSRRSCSRSVADPTPTSSAWPMNSSKVALASRNSALVSSMSTNSSTSIRNADGGPPQDKRTAKRRRSRVPLPWKLLFVGLVLAGLGALGAFWWSWSELDQARLEVERGLYARARIRLERLASWVPVRGELDLLLGHCQQATGSPDEALATWSLIPDDSPLAGEAALRRGRLALALGRFEPAESALRALASGGGEDGPGGSATLSELASHGGPPG